MAPRPPRTLTKDEWLAQGGPDYDKVMLWRQYMTARLQAYPPLIQGMDVHYAQAPWDWINHWVMTYDPRRLDVGSGAAAYVPLIMFTRQEEFIRLLYQAFTEQVNVLVDKSRDMGVTWLACAFSVWLWRYYPGSAIGWGSRVADLVDKLGVPDSIFEKMRIILRWLPKAMLPQGFDINDTSCSSERRILNPETKSSIQGEIGDNIGRGGRKLIMFKDESSHYEHPEMIEAALTSNTNIQVDISTVNGPATLFQRKRDTGSLWVPDGPVSRTKVNVFVFDYTDHPMKTYEWYEETRIRMEDQGLAHVFAQEVTRDPTAAISGTIIRGEWVRAAIGAREALGLPDDGAYGAGLDVADEDKKSSDRNALCIRRGLEAKRVDEWGARDPGVSTRHVIQAVEGLLPIEVQYDSIAMGVAVKAEVNRLKDLRLLPRGLEFVSWRASESPISPEGRVNEDDDRSPINKDFFQNLKAQAWWQVARRFEKTFRARRGDEGFTWDQEDIISIAPDMMNLQQLVKELSQPVMTKSPATLKNIVDKKPDGARSPDLADAFIMAFWPANAQRPMQISKELMHNLRRRGEMRRRMRSSGYGYQY